MAAMTKKLRPPKREREHADKSRKLRKYLARCVEEKPGAFGDFHGTNGARLSVRMHIMLQRIDDAMIGTPDYMGIAYWWNYEYRHYLRPATPAERKKAHDKLILEGLPLDGMSDQHAEIIQRITKASCRRAYGTA